MEPGPDLEDDDDDLISIALQDVIYNEVKPQVPNALAKLLDMVQEAVEQLFHTAPLSAEQGIRTVAYDTVEHVVLD